MRCGKQPERLSSLIAYVPFSVKQGFGPLRIQPEEAEGDMVSGTFFSGLGVNLPYGSRLYG